MWEIGKSKFYKEIMSSLATFFGKEEATEAELHQELKDSGTIESINAKALEAAEAAVSDKLKQAETKAADLQTQIDTLSATVTDQQTQIETLQGEVTEKDNTIATQNTKITELQTKIAGHIAGKKTTEEGAPDTPPPAGPGSGGNKDAQNVMSNKELEELLNV